MPWNNSSRPLLSLSNASYSRTFHPQHPPDLHPRYPLQIYCSLMVDSHGDNVETINLCISHQQFITEKTENVWVKENTPHMTFHEMTHKDRVLTVYTELCWPSTPAVTILIFPLEDWKFYTLFEWEKKSQKIVLILVSPRGWNVKCHCEISKKLTRMCTTDIIVT